tara:strand:+ start:6247 stop:8889 length:2643 start_codon:yes stop_codon:yes gene_type:complete
LKNFLDIFKGTENASLKAFILFLTLFGGSVLASFYIYNVEQERSQNTFNKYSINIHEAIYGRLDYYQNVLKSTSAMLMDNRSLTHTEFKNYTNNIGIKENFPGMTSMGVAKIVSSEDLESFISEMRSQGLRSYEVWPESANKQVYAPVKTIAPFDTILKPLSGFDLFSEESRAVPMLEASVDGKETISRELKLLTKEEKNTEGFYIFYPIYSSAEIPPRKEQRSLLKSGYVFGVFSTKRLFDTILAEQEGTTKFVSVKVSIKGAGSPRLIYNSNADFQPQFVENKTLPVANNELIFSYESTPYFESEIAANFHWVILGLGFIFSAIIFLMAKKVLKAKKSLEENEKDLKKTSQANALLAKESQILSSSLDTQTNLKSLANFYSNNFECGCIVYFSEEGDQKLSQVSFPESYSDDLKRIQLEELESSGIKKKVLDKESYVISAPDEERKIGEIIGLPLTMRGKLYGIVSLLKEKRGETFGQDAVKLLKQLTSLTTLSLENTLLYREAQLANRLKDEFLATVSHELRTPLNVIYGHSQLLLEDKLNPDHRDQIQAIFRSAKAQSAIIEDLLDISSIISGKLKFQPRPVKVMDAIETAVKSVELEAKKKNIEIIQSEPHQCIIMGVKTRLVQIFWNLLSNAIKFTPEKGKIAIKSSIKDQHCVIQVIDTGKGIDPEFLPHIFEKFRQEEMSSTRSMGGLGLGLSIVSHLTDLHGGSIVVTSEGVNQGTTFKLSFPLASLSATAAAQRDTSKPKEVKEHDLHDISILAVDDEPDSLNLITRILRSHKAKVFTADNALDALKKMKTERPDVLISDIAMPEMDGYDLIKEIRIKEKGQGTHIPAIALTAFAQEEDKARALKSGYDKYLAKPVNKEKLIDTVERALH